MYIRAVNRLLSVALSRSRSRMFSIVSETWNPVTGCLHGCTYCWARRLALTRLAGTKKYMYGFYPTIHEEEFSKRFSGGFIFVCDMGDLFGSWVPREWIDRVVSHVSKFRDTFFLFMTKNPSRYLELEHVPDNVVLGTTIETNLDDLATRFSKAPPPSDRYKAMVSVEHPLKLVSVEPVMDFDVDVMSSWIRDIEPAIVFIGYDNYNNRLPEPPAEKVEKLIESVLDVTIVVRKTMKSC